ncbi:hypothetical protein [Nocardia farcinica]|uniref:hypothetical protein n=1 Tax=Nocardia farcinica TaxID=37329 RepID=UPI001893938B|nr:hypothetical protein [Nocardia farcinica]MBF6070146.1 hypothetical protein [Nocardia farcinica]
MSNTTKVRLAALNARAARRSMAVRKAPEVGMWELSTPFRVVVHGSLDNITAWLDAAESVSR